MQVAAPAARSAPHCEQTRRTHPPGCTLGHTHDRNQSGTYYTPARRVKARLAVSTQHIQANTRRDGAGGRAASVPVPHGLPVRRSKIRIPLLHQVSSMYARNGFLPRSSQFHSPHHCWIGPPGSPKESPPGLAGRAQPARRFETTGSHPSLVAAAAAHAPPPGQREPQQSSNLHAKGGRQCEAGSLQASLCCQQAPAGCRCCTGSFRRTLTASSTPSSGASKSLKAWLVCSGAGGPVVEGGSPASPSSAQPTPGNTRA